MAGKGGGGVWKVAYADFVTAMMAFFLVMWITAQDKPVREAIASYFEDPTSTEPGSGSVRQNVPPASSLIGPLNSGRGPGRGPTGTDVGPKSQSDSGAKRKRPKLKMFQRPDQTRSVGTMVLFAENSAELDELARNQLIALVPQFRGKPHKIEIRGHTTRSHDAPDADAAALWQLCFARCLATMDFLTRQGLEQGRIRLSLAGASEPYSNRLEPEWQAHNSRVEVFAINEFAQPFEPAGEDRTGNFKMQDDPAPDSAPAEPPPTAAPAEHQ